MERMQEILYFRKLDFPLKEICAILADPHYDRQAALRQQRTLLLMKRDRMDGLVRLLEENLKGESTMDFKGFDKTEIENARRQYAAEAKARWGTTEAYRESQVRTAKNTQEDWDSQTEEMNAIFRRAAALRSGDPAGDEAQALVGEWQGFISCHYYTCSKEILSGLGQMYTADERFRENLDRFGQGTSGILSKAIAVYCGE